MPSRIELATALFDQLSEDLATVRPERKGLFICPLCLRTFDRSALMREDENGLTLDHIIPEALGGRKTTLTCKSCNNTDGSVLDAHFVRMIGVHNWQDGDGSFVKGRINREGEYLPILLSWGTGEKVIKILGGKPEVLRKFEARPVSDGDTVNLTLRFDFNPSNAQRAQLRMGFLVLCHTFGYAYTLSGAADYVRKLLKRLYQNPNGDRDQLQDERALGG